jgi:predicted transposase YdaD
LTTQQFEASLRYRRLWEEEGEGEGEGRERGREEGIREGGSRPYSPAGTQLNGVLPHKR